MSIARDLMESLSPEKKFGRKDWWNYGKEENSARDAIYQKALAALRSRPSSKSLTNEKGFSEYHQKSEALLRKAFPKVKFRKDFYRRVYLFEAERSGTVWDVASFVTDLISKIEGIDVKAASMHNHPILRRERVKRGLEPPRGSE